MVAVAIGDIVRARNVSKIARGLERDHLGIDGVFSDCADTAFAARELFELEASP
jgi:hypothetical protein